jgi:ketosteroid isomerase-like protein
MKRPETSVNRVTTRRLAVSALLFVLSAVLARAQEHSKQVTEAATHEVLKVDDQFNQAVQAKDAKALERILANDLSWIARGDRLNKSQVIADVLTQNLHFKSLTHDSLVVKVFGNTAIITGHSSSILEYKGKLFDAPRLFTNVYMKLDGRWQLVAHHVSDLAKT